MGTDIGPGRHSINLSMANPSVKNVAGSNLANKLLASKALQKAIKRLSLFQQLYITYQKAALELRIVIPTYQGIVRPFDEKLHAHYQTNSKGKRILTGATEDSR